MGLLESVIGGVLGPMSGGRKDGAGRAGMSPLVQALLMLLLAKGASGALGDILGRAHGAEPGPEAARSGGPPSGRHDSGPPSGGDIGGFDQWGGRREPGPDGADAGGDPSLPPDDFSDLSGMLDGPGAGTAGGSTPEPDRGGLDGLVDRFRRTGLGDVMESWIGPGANRPVAPEDLAGALGPDTLDALQRRTGMDRGALLAGLAEALPEVIHALTPQGRVPDPHERRDW